MIPYESVILHFLNTRYCHDQMNATDSSTAETDIDDSNEDKIEERGLEILDESLNTFIADISTRLDNGQPVLEHHAFNEFNELMYKQSEMTGQ